MPASAWSTAVADAGSFDPSAAGLSDDGLLNRAISLYQPRTGYRAGSDAVLLAASVPAQAGEAVLDVGVGAGAAALCVAWRCLGVQVTGLEVQADLAALARQNAGYNNLGDRIAIETGDLRRAPAAIASTQYDHVICNPPFYPAGTATPSPRASKTTAHLETDDLALAEWVTFCLKRARPGGTVTMIHRAERLTDLLAACQGGAGDVHILPLWPSAGRPAKRVVVQARAQRNGPTVVLPGLTLHTPEGDDTPSARAILRDGAALDLSAD